MASGEIKKNWRYYNGHYLVSPVVINAREYGELNTGIPYPGDGPIVFRHAILTEFINAYSNNGTLWFTVFNPSSNQLTVDKVWFYYLY